jgi:hypothetical protein
MVDRDFSLAVDPESSLAVCGLQFMQGFRIWPVSDLLHDFLELGTIVLGQKILHEDEVDEVRIARDIVEEVLENLHSAVEVGHVFFVLVLLGDGGNEVVRVEAGQVIP